MHRQDMKPHMPTPQSVAELFQRVCQANYVLGYSSGLNPAQWSALRYFARANRNARTVSAYFKSHGITSGTASQTVAALVRKGYLISTPVPGDGRAKSLEVTEAGAEFLENDPVRSFIAVLDDMDGADRLTLAEAMERFLREVYARGILAGPMPPVMADAVD